jgi:PKD repeat protein
MAFLLCSSLIVGCTGDEPAEEKVQPAPVQATALPPAAPTEAPAATDPAAAEDPYEDSLVLLAEGEPDAGPAPLTVQFVVESLVVDEISGARYTWDFGDGSAKSTEAGPTHTYEKPGDYTATVGVVDANGERGWDEVDIIVEEPEGVTP